MAKLPISQLQDPSNYNVEPHPTLAGNFVCTSRLTGDTLTVTSLSTFINSQIYHHGAAEKLPGETRDVNGENAVTFKTGNVTYSGRTVTRIQLLTDCKFSGVFGDDVDNSGFPVGATLPAGLVLFGRYATIQLTSGSVALYH